MLKLLLSLKRPLETLRYLWDFFPISLEFLHCRDNLAICKYAHLDP